MNDHFVLCGLGNVGFRVLSHLLQMGEQVVAIERDGDGRFVAAARSLKVPVIIGDIRLPSILEARSIKRSSSRADEKSPDDMNALILSSPSSIEKPPSAKSPLRPSAGIPRSSSPIQITPSPAFS